MKNARQLFNNLPFLRQKKRRDMMEKNLLRSGLALAVLLFGLIAGYFVVTQFSTLDPRQQAAGAPAINVNPIAGFNCSGTSCTMANSDWCAGGAVMQPDGRCKYENNVPADNQLVRCTPTQKAIKYSCPNGLVDGRCLEARTEIFGGTIPAGGSQNLDPEMPNKCGAYQFDFSDINSQDSNGNCGAVTYVWPDSDCDGDTDTPTPPGDPTPTPKPTPACTINVVRRVNNQNSALNGTIRLNVNQAAMLRAQVSDVPSFYQVHSVTFRSQDLDMASFFPNEPTVDTDAPYEATFRVKAYREEPGRLRARVRLRERESGKINNDVICQTNVNLIVNKPADPTPTPTATPTNTPTPTPSLCNGGCVTDANCSTGYCYQPPMPTCPPGLDCIQVFPPKVCRNRNNPTSPTCSGPTPTPTTAICNERCTTNADCTTTGYCYQPPMPTCAPGLNCAQVFPPKVCRLQTNPTSATCEGPTPTPTNSPTPTPSWTPTPSPTNTPTPTPVAGCNKSCTQNADCSNSNHLCVEIDGAKVCRLQTNIQSTTCNEPTPTPTPTSIATVTPTVTPGLPSAGNASATSLVVIVAGISVLILGSLAFILLL